MGGAPARGQECASRGAGRAIAAALGEQSATDYVTGRSVRGQLFGAEGFNRVDAVRAKRRDVAGDKGGRSEHDCHDGVCPRIRRLHLE